MRATHVATSGADGGRRRHTSGSRPERRAAAPCTCHAGLAHAARRLAARVMASMPGDAPIVVDSAGCGAPLKDYGHLLGTPEAAAFAHGCVDVHEWLAGTPRPAARRVARPAPPGDRPGPVPPPPRPAGPRRVRVVLGRYVDVVELDDEGLCCGAGGAYAALHPDLAGDIRGAQGGGHRRPRPVRRHLVASANPGCAMHLAAAGVDVRHPVDIVAAALALT